MQPNDNPSAKVSIQIDPARSISTIQRWRSGSPPMLHHDFRLVAARHRLESPGSERTSLRRMAAGSMLVRISADRVEVQARAKINLLLEILSKRLDGYHEIETLMSPFGLYDSLSLRTKKSPQTRLDCRWAAGLAAAQGGRESLASGTQPDGQSRTPETPDPVRDAFGDLPPPEENIVFKAASLLQQRS